MAELLNTKTLDTMSLSTQVASAADISTFVNTTASDTLGGAKTYTDAEISALSADFNARIAALEGFTSFIGVKDSLPETAEDGQICIVGNKEYIYGSKADGTVGWTELGDTTAETAAIEELSNAVAALETTKANASDVNASVEALTSAIEAVEASLSGYDTVGSAAAAQEAAVAAAKAYTDEQIAAVESEISSLTDVVETKADKATVDAALSAIEDDISTLTAKEETDPVFTDWKDGTSIALGENSTSEFYGAVGIGPNARANNDNCVQIGEGANFEENSFQFRSTQIVDSDGFITTSNLAGMNDLRDAILSVPEVTASDDIATLRSAVNTLRAAIASFTGVSLEG